MFFVIIQFFIFSQFCLFSGINSEIWTHILKISQNCDIESRNYLVYYYLVPETQICTAKRKSEEIKTRKKLQWPYFKSILIYFLKCNHFFWKCFELQIQGISSPIGLLSQNPSHIIMTAVQTEQLVCVNSDTELTDACVSLCSGV